MFVPNVDWFSVSEMVLLQKTSSREQEYVLNMVSFIHLLLRSHKAI